MLDRLLEFADGLPTERAGLRIADSGVLRPLLMPGGPIGRVAAEWLGSGCQPVRAILFDKNRDRNWSLSWHQDRTIHVKERRPAPGFDRWTVKQGQAHVEPPAALLAQMVTLRVHLDDVALDNAPLLVAPGSHRFGRIAEAAIADTVRGCGTAACTARAGDVWVYSTPILHASERARRPARRRVIQIDYSAETLPSGLEWAGV